MNRLRIMKKKRISTAVDDFARAAGRGLRRAAKDARKTARQHGTQIYIWQDGKVVALEP